MALPGYARAALLLLIGGGIAWGVIHGGGLDPLTLVNWVERHGESAEALFAGIYAAGILLLLPRTILSWAGGALFGMSTGLAINLVGGMAGAVLAFFLARNTNGRNSNGEWLCKRLGNKGSEILTAAESEGWRFVTFMRLTPLSFGFLSYALGFTRVAPRSYLLATAVCMIPGAVTHTWLGYAGRKLLEEGGNPGPEVLLRFGLVALALVGAGLFLPRMARRLRQTPALAQADSSQG